MALGSFLVASGCGSPQEQASPAAPSKPRRLMLFCAGSLKRPMDRIAKEFERAETNVRVGIEPSGSRVVINKWTQLGRRVDVVAVADYRLVVNETMPEHTDWCIAFAGNRMVIAYTERSRFTAEITGENWYRVLARPGVQVGRADPNKDPCGYRALMALQLADMHYSAEDRGGRSILDAVIKNSPPNNVRPAAMELPPLLESRQLDYAIEYQSFAVQHNLKYVPLPDEINLSNPDNEAFYAKAKVKVSGRKPGETMTYKGSTIVYGITIPRESEQPELAAKFTAFVLGPEGRKAFEELGMPCLARYRQYGKDLPALIEGFFAGGAAKE